MKKLISKTPDSGHAEDLWKKALLNKMFAAERQLSISQFQEG